MTDHELTTSRRHVGTGNQGNVYLGTASCPRCGARLDSRSSYSEDLVEPAAMEAFLRKYPDCDEELAKGVLRS